MNSDQRTSQKTGAGIAAACVDIFGNKGGSNLVKGTVDSARDVDDDHLGCMGHAFQELRDQIFWYRKELEKKNKALNDMKENGSFGSDKNLKR